MFAVVTKDGQSGIIRNFVDRITFRHSSVEICSVLDSSFALIRARGLHRSSDWAKICEITGCASCRELVLQEGLTISPGRHRARAFQGWRFALCMATNLVLSLLKECRLPPQRRVVGLLDAQGRAQLGAMKLGGQCAAVKVVTQPRYQPGYEALAERQMQDSGTTLLLCNTIEELADCAVVIAAGECVLGGLRLPCPVIEAGRVMDAGETMVIHSLFSQVPPEIISVIPKGVPPMLFLAALYELNVEEAMAQLEVCGGKTGERIIEAREIANIINNLR